MANTTCVRAKLFVPVGLALILTLTTTYLCWSVSATALAHRKDRAQNSESIGSFNSNHSRAPSEKELYKQSIVRGDALYKIIMGKKPIPATRFTNSADLATWGWEATKKEVPDAYVLKSHLEHIEAPMRETGIGTQADKNLVVDMTHSQQTTRGGRIYPPTGAKYWNIYNPSEGVIFSYKNYGPADFQKRSNNPSQGQPLPELSHWSDVVFLTYQHISSSQHQPLTNLKTVIRVSVDDGQTLQLTPRALSKDKCRDQYPTWEKRHTFRPGSEAYLAMLGSEHARGVVWLLTQHRTSFGGRFVKGITVWFTDVKQGAKLAKPIMSMLIEIGHLGEVRTIGSREWSRNRLAVRE